MEITDVPFAVLRFQYQLARLPLQLFEEQVVAGMSSEAPTRLFYERWLGGLDASVGKMLGDPDLEKRGAALIERSDALRRAAQLDATATQNQQQADDELKAKRDKAIEDQNDARAVTAREVEEARTAAEQWKGAAAEAAQKRISAAKQQADELAAQRMTSAEAAKRDEQATIRAAEQKATAAAESKLDDAQAKRSDAASKRAQADQVEELASLERQKRQSERANDA
jgi:cell wall-associated NlpC family hydrolase